MERLVLHDICDIWKIDPFIHVEWYLQDSAHDICSILNFNLPFCVATFYFGYIWLYNI